MYHLDDFQFKRKKYLPIYPKANGKPTTYIEGYPSEDDEPMSATGFHGEQITILSRQLKMHFADSPAYIGVDSFIYYSEHDRSKFVAPDIYVVLGVEPFPERRSFYTWAEGAVPTAVFEFLSDSTASIDRNQKVGRYMIDIGVSEYFIHQPEGDKPPEFRGWRRSPSGTIEEITADEEGGLFSRSLNLWLRWEEMPRLHVRLLRPYMPDGTMIPTPDEWKEIAEDQKQRLETVEVLAEEEARRRQQAELVAEEEAQHRRQLESELEQLRAQLAALQSKPTE